MICLLLLSFAVTPLDFETVKSESNPVKRTEKALDFSYQKLTEAREHASAGNYEEMGRAVAEIADGADVALESIRAKRNVRAMKKAEQRCRDILRRLDTLRQDLPPAERGPVEKAVARIQEVQERILQLALGRKP